MSDDSRDDLTGAEENPPVTGESVEDAPARRPSPGAQAASRARRIGGRPLPTPRPGGTATDASARAATPPETKAAGKTPAGATAPAKPARPAREKERARPRATTDIAVLERRMARLRWVPAAFAALAVVAMLVLGVWQSHGVWWGKRLHDTRSQQQQEVLAAAKTCATALLTYDYHDLNAAQKKGDNCASAAYRPKYDEAFNKFVRTLAPTKKASLTLQIENGGVQSVSPDGKQWVVLLYAQQSYADTSTKGSPRLDVVSFAITLSKTKGTWLVDALNPTG